MRTHSRIVSAAIRPRSYPRTVSAAIRPRSAPCVPGARDARPAKSPRPLRAGSPSGADNKNKNDDNNDNVCKFNDYTNDINIINDSTNNDNDSSNNAPSGAGRRTCMRHVGQEAIEAVRARRRTRRLGVPQTARETPPGAGSVPRVIQAKRVRCTQDGT